MKKDFKADRPKYQGSSSNNHEPPDDYLKTTEAAQLLKISKQFLEIARHRGDGPPYCKLGRAVRYRRAALLDWALSNEQPR